MFFRNVFGHEFTQYFYNSRTPICYCSSMHTYRVPTNQVTFKLIPNIVVLVKMASINQNQEKKGCFRVNLLFVIVWYHPLSFIIHGNFDACGYYYISISVYLGTRTCICHNYGFYSNLRQTAWN